MNGQSKSIFTSVTFWGIALGFAAPLLAHLGYTLPADSSGLANQIAGAVGDMIALYGRLRAVQPVHVIAPASNP